MSETTESGLHLNPMPRVGQALGRFLIERELPRGGQARVYRAWQTDLQRAVALKLLPASFAADSDALTRFRAEIENVAKITHPNIVRVYDAGDLDGHPYFAMEFIDGVDAETRVKRGPLGPDEAAAIMEAISRAVQDAHKSGVIHRDIKPGNIILRRDGTPVLTDFGLAQDLTQSAQLTRTGVSMGTPAYMSPEQARGERNRVGIRSDIYALGATLFTLLTGRRPVEGESAYELMVKVAESQGPKWPRYALEDVPVDLRSIVEMAMQNDPGKRYESATALADDLERFLHGEWVVARSRSKLSRLWLRWRRYVPVAAVVTLALGLAGGMVYTGLNVSPNAGNEAPPLDSFQIGFTDDADPTEDLEPLFNEEGKWTRSGAAVSRGQGNEILLARTGPEPIFIAPRDGICWGDFTLQTQFRVRKADGPLQFMVGMPDEGTQSETAYIISLGSASRDRFELRRLGGSVLSGYRAGGRTLLEDDVSYRAVITRAGQTVSFLMSEIMTGLPVLEFRYEDPFPALISGVRNGNSFGRQRFGIEARSDQLALSNVTVSHRDSRYSTETLLFSVAQYDEAERWLTARLSEQLPAGAAAAEREERAELFYMRARCRVGMNAIDDALSDVASGKVLVESGRLRGQLFMLGSAIETRRGNDDFALAQLRVAQLSLLQSPDLAGALLHDAFNRASSLAATQPERALLYYDFLAGNALGSPYIVCAALASSAEIRLRLAQTLPAEQADPLRLTAVEALERIEGAGYQRFAAVYVPAMTRLFELRWESLMADPTNPARVTSVQELAGWLAGSIGSYLTPHDELLSPLVRASWLGRLGASAADAQPWQQARQRLLALSQHSEATGLRLQLALTAEERPELSEGPEARVAAWRELAAGLDLTRAEHAMLAVVCEYFIGYPADEADARRRSELLRSALRRDFKLHETFWFADADADAFASYCIGLRGHNTDRRQAERILEDAAAGKAPGALALLKGRAGRWLPVAR